MLSGAFGGAQTRKVDTNPVTTADSFFVVANTTGILPTKQTYLTIWSGDTAKPSASNLDVNPGLVRAASTYAPLSWNKATVTCPTACTTTRARCPSPWTSPARSTTARACPR